MARGNDYYRASVRITRDAGDGSRIVASGTVVESTESEALIVGCAHQFREGTDNVLIETFWPERRAYRAEVILLDETNDLSVLRVETDAKLTAIPVAPAEHKLALGDAAVTIGCGGGTPPRGFLTRVTSINRYIGWDNLETLGPYVPGDSGGGLFHRRRLIGVQSAADTTEWHKLFAGPAAIRAIVQSAKSKLAPPPPPPPVATPAPTEPPPDVPPPPPPPPKP